MHGNILKRAEDTKCLHDIKSAMREVGCDLCEVDDLTDVAHAIRKQLCAGPNAVINASLAAGPGIKVSPIDRKGYRISANDEATLTGDICDHIQKGDSIHKALFKIVNNIIPAAMKKAAQTPAVIDVEVFKSSYDGTDFYNNKAYGRHGAGRKSGLYPDSWYVKIYLFAQVEPLYVALGPVVADMKKEIMEECHHMICNMFDDHVKECCQHTCNCNHTCSCTKPEPVEPNVPGCGCGCNTPDPEPEIPEPSPEPEPGTSGSGCELCDPNPNAEEEDENMKEIDDILNRI